jgi:tetratricopeptide (TPR) repeat protein
VAAVAGIAWIATGPQPCDGDRGIQKVWNAERRATLTDAVIGTEAAYAGETARRVSSRLDAYVARWTEAALTVCRERGRGEVDPVVLDVRQGCLDRRREELKVTLDVLEHAASVERAVMTVADLPDPSICSTLGADDRPIVSADAAALVDALRLRLARSAALAGVGDFDAAVEEASAVRADAEEAQLAEEALEGQLALGRLEQLRGNPEAAAEHLSAAALQATAGKHDAIAAEAAIAMIHIAGGWQASFEAAEDWNRHAVAALERMGMPPGLEANRLYSMGVLGVMRADPDLGQPLFERALALHRETLDEEHPRVALDLAALADAKLRADDTAGGVKYAELALASAKRAFGEHHPRTAVVRITVGNVMFRIGEYEQAGLYFERGRDDLEASLGLDTPVLGPAYEGLGAALQRIGDLDAALVAFERANEVVNGERGIAGHPNVARIANMLAEVRIERGEYDAALAQAQRSVAMREKIFGADHHELVVALLTEARALLGLGRAEDAWRRIERVDRVVGDRELSGPREVYRLSVSGQALLALGRDAQAVAFLEAARRKQEEIQAATFDRAEVDFHLARALDRTGDRARAETLAMAAREAFGDRAPQQVARVDAWLAR